MALAKSKLFPTFLLVALCLCGGVVLAYEEPKFTVVHQADGYEVRRYADRLAAQVIQSNNQNSAFGVLFRYISGANQSSEKVSMTIPVAQSEKIEMTVPVAQSSGSEGRYMQFFLPSKYTLESAPQPTNPDVQIVVVEGGFYAVYSYSGRATDENFARAKAQLLGRLAKDGRRTLSEVVRATYNGPFTIPFLRRNEAMVRIEWPE